MSFVSVSLGHDTEKQGNLNQENCGIDDNGKDGLMNALDQQISESPNTRVLAQRTSEALRMCANCPDFAVICAFLEKFHKELGLELPNFQHLQEWLSAPNESEWPFYTSTYVSEINTKTHLLYSSSPTTAWSAYKVAKENA